MSRTVWWPLLPTVVIFWHHFIFKLAFTTAEWCRCGAVHEAHYYHDACWYIKRHKLGLYVSHATTPPLLKCACTPLQWSLGRKLIYLYTVPCYSVQHFSCLQVKSWIFPYTSVYDLKVKVTQYIQARYSGVMSVKGINENLLESIICRSGCTGSNNFINNYDAPPEEHRDYHVM